MHFDEGELGLPGLMLMELDSWRQSPVADEFPSSRVVRYIRSVGKHFLATPVVEELVRVRAGQSEIVGDDDSREHLRRFLSVVLDKHDGTYDYTTYTALDLLRPRNPEPLPDFEEEVATRIAFLLYDALAFECGAALGYRSQLPCMRPSREAVEKRLRHGLRVATEMDRLSAKPITPKVSSLQERYDQLVDVLEGAPPGMASRLEQTLLPVYIIHDEYLFIRVLQSFESIFEHLARLASEAILRLEARDAEEALLLLSSITRVLSHGLPLFSLLATMQRESFEFFRKFTEGASAIQSVNYKTFEALCGTPPPARVESPAFQSVPEVRGRVLQSMTTVRGAADALIASGAHDAEVEARLARAMAQIEAVHQRWKRTHYRLAVRMIGSVSGTGYTEGTPYLRSVIDNRLFRRAEETTN
ncbi:tryptophan 2,3-dioxygenase [Streptomyces sp. NPDC057705]|uniref:tryptophan 2,3-dioxygenase n=1 Tax=Streptomyces sp. NPDC057705 TaxID=3346222 RepID=UPI0036C517D5